MRRGMGIFSHSHPHSKGCDHTGERYCCSLEGLAQAHVCLSSMSLFSLSKSGSSTTPFPGVPSYLNSSVSSLECFPAHHQNLFLSLTVFHFWFFSPFSHFYSFFTLISLTANSFVYLHFSSLPLSWPTHWLLFFLPLEILFIPTSK